MKNIAIALWALGSVCGINPLWSINSQSIRLACAEQELTLHQWTLKEMIVTKDDTSTNITVFQVPCEKDNILDFHENGTYQVLEGATRCQASDDQVKGEGAWEFETAEQVLVDAYNGGRLVRKKVLVLSPNMLKVQFEGEGNTTTTLTYLSELGQEDEVIAELVEDDSDQFQNLTKILKSLIAESSRYKLIGLKDFRAGENLKEQKKEGIRKNVLVYPFMDGTKGDIVEAQNSRDNDLIQEAKRSLVDYIVTGNIKRKEAVRNSDGTYYGDIEFNIFILDVKLEQKTASKTFRRKKTKGMQSLLVELNGLMHLPIVQGIMMKSLQWNDFYNLYFKSNQISRQMSDLNSVFSTVQNDEREKQYKSSYAVMEAFTAESNKTRKFLFENLFVPVGVNNFSLNKKGKFQALTIEAGQNIGLSKRELVMLMRVTENGQAEEICELVVDKVDSEQLATCKVRAMKPGAKKKLMDAYEDGADRLFVHPTGRLTGIKGINLSKIISRD